MAWTRSDDTTLLHPKVLRAGRGGDDRMVNEVYGFVARCCTWSGGLLQDGFIPQEIAEVASPTRHKILIKAAISAGMLTKRHRNAAGDVGWTVVQDDNLFHVRSKDEVLKDREASARLSRVQKVSRDVRIRDGDQCRYCARTVTFQGDRRSLRAGTYDHVIPPELDGTDELDNVVVACGGCNRRKAKRTPDEAGMQLLDPPAQPFYSPNTRSQLHLDDDPAGPAPDARTDDPGDAADPSARTQPTVTAANTRPEAPASDPARQPTRSPRARPASDLDLPTSGGSPGSGSGRDGCGSGLAPPPTSSGDPPRRRTRGSRGRRSSAAQPAPPQHQEPDHDA